MDLLKLAALPDFITPTMAMVRDAAAGDAATLWIEENGWWSGREVQRLLMDFGVESWGWFCPSFEDGIRFSIHEPQLEYALHVLREHEVPIVT